MENPWVEDLVQFLREQPGVRAVRIDQNAHKIAVATVGKIELGDLEAKLAETIAAVEAQMAAHQVTKAPTGYRVRQEGAMTVIGRESCETAEKFWLWREMEWPEIKPESGANEQEWRKLALLATVCGTAGVAGVVAAHLFPGTPLLARACFIVGLVAGGWDATIDTGENLRKGKIDIHFLMIAVAMGAVFINAWGEAVLLLFLFSASGAMEEYALDRTQREVSALLKSAPKKATLILADGTEKEIPIEELRLQHRVHVKPGDAFPADGTIVKGRSASDESALTGEAVPVEKSVGDPVFSGTINLWGAIECEVIRLPSGEHAAKDHPPHSNRAETQGAKRTFHP